MYHPIPREWLLATNKIEVIFKNCHNEKSFHGSGFWIQKDEKLFFATNRHVIDIDYNNNKYIGQGDEFYSVKILLFKPANQTGGYFDVTRATLFIPDNYSIDIALLRLQSINNPNNIKVLPADVSIIADKDFLTTELEWGAQVSFSSFQPWGDTQTDSPILRTGILASDPAYPFNSTMIGKIDIHLLEAFSFNGSSGSPVFANAQGIPAGKGLTGGNFRPARIIGIMTGHLLNEQSEAGTPDKTHTGLSYCHRSDLLLSMINEDVPMNQFEFIARK